MGHVKNLKVVKVLVCLAVIFILRFCLYGGVSIVYAETHVTNEISSETSHEPTSKLNKGDVATDAGTKAVTVDGTKDTKDTDDTEDTEETNTKGLTLFELLFYLSVLPVCTVISILVFGVGSSDSFSLFNMTECKARVMVVELWYKSINK